MITILIYISNRNTRKCMILATVTSIAEMRVVIFLIFVSLTSASPLLQNNEASGRGDEEIFMTTVNNILKGLVKHLIQFFSIRLK